MGNGTFNLRFFYRAMGIKNPEPGVREFVQPVVNVGNFAGLTPAYEPPTFLGGGMVSAAVGEWSIIQIRSVAPGGTYLKKFNANNGDFIMGIVATATAGLTAVDDLGPLSFEPSVVVVLEGNDAVSPITGSFPNVRVQGGMNMCYPLFIPPGRIFSIQGAAQNQEVNYSLCLMDVPAAELPPE